jgi:hypothetical protein
MQSYFNKFKKFCRNYWVSREERKEGGVGGTWRQRGGSPALRKGGRREELAAGQRGRLTRHKEEWASLSFSFLKNQIWTEFPPV